MPLLKNNEFVPDPFVAVADDANLPPYGKVLIPASRLHTALATPLEIGIRLANTDREESLTPHFTRISLIVLPFPSFGDGRSYSIARQLRLDGYRGELRAEGNVLPDQLQYMRQVGFDSFNVTDRFPLAMWQAAFHQMSLAYQRGFYRDHEVDVWSTRHRGINSSEKPSHVD